MTSPYTTVIISYAARQLTLDLDPQSNSDVLRAQIESLTGVPPPEQHLMGLGLGEIEPAAYLHSLRSVKSGSHANLTRVAPSFAATAAAASRLAQAAQAQAASHFGEAPHASAAHGGPARYPPTWSSSDLTTEQGFDSARHDRRVEELSDLSAAGWSNGISGPPFVHPSSGQLTQRFDATITYVNHDAPARGSHTGFCVAGPETDRIWIPHQVLPP